MKADLVLVGGGLANSLIAYRLSEARPELDLRLLERGGSPGGSHVWSFHGGDLDAAQRAWVAPLVERSWPRHEVRFPGLRRRLSGSYHSLTSRRLARALGERLGERLETGVAAVEVGPRAVRTADGRELSARAVIDGRGAVESPALALAWQKFLGLHVRLEEPSGLEGPILMDATVDQLDGFRFLYTLPFGERRLLIEDTRYSDGPALDRGAMREGIHRYAAARGWRIASVTGEEEGVLPIALAGDIDGFWSEAAPGLPRAGMRAALFHPTTGYSLPEAVRLADDIASLGELESGDLDRRIRRRSRALWRRGGYFRLLNRMLFRAAEPDERYRVLERFYSLPEPLIARFYAGRPSLADRLRTLTGRPPVPVGRALACLLPRTRAILEPSPGARRE